MTAHDRSVGNFGNIIMDQSTSLAEFSETERGLAELRHRYESVVFDVSTKEGEKAARSAKREIVSLRTGLDKARLLLNADDQARISKRNEVAKKITAQILEMETPISEQIKAKEERVAAAKAEAERLEKERIEKMQGAIATLKDWPYQLLGKSAFVVGEAIESLKSSGFLSQFDDIMLPSATHTYNAVLDQLAKLHNERVEAEAEANRQAAARADLERQQAELKAAQDAAEEAQRAAEAAQAEARAEQDRIAEEERAKAAEAEAAARQKAEAEAQAERDRVAAEQRAELERLEAERAEQAEAADRERLAREQAELDNATLTDAALAALALLTDLGQTHHIATRTLAAALKRELPKVEIIT